MIKLVLGLLPLLLFLNAVDLSWAQTITTPLSTSSTSIANGTQVLPVIIQPNNGQPTASTQINDNPSFLALMSLLITGIGIPVATKYLKDKDAKDKEQETFRLEATSSTLKAQNQSLEETDRAAYQQSRIIKGMLDVMCQKQELKDMFNAKKIDGIGLVDYVDRFVSESGQDIEEYYNRNRLPEDKFDTCNDDIVKQMAAVRNKSRK
ncbi:MAG: hypothetical protein R2685_10555 [Candidatus Nitrosocosmicus sp.]|nr:hypothetical protein [Candidatus Nitrosocosmicus sp.]